MFWGHKKSLFSGPMVVHWTAAEQRFSPSQHSKISIAPRYFLSNKYPQLDIEYKNAKLDLYGLSIS
jgi:hypothetical protein